MTSYARYRYGSDIWDKRQAATSPSRFLFSAAFKHHAGVSINEHYKETFDYLKNEWEKQDTGVVVPSYSSPKVKKYTSYRYPQLLNDSTIIAVKSSLDDLNYLVLLTDGKEKRLTYIGRINSRLHIRNGHVYWTEIVPGIRWTHENYSVLKRYDPEEKRILNTYSPPTLSGSCNR